MKPQDRWDKENAKVLHIKLFLTKDSDILEWWNNIPNGEKANTFRRMAKKEIKKIEKTY